MGSCLTSVHFVKVCHCVDNCAHLRTGSFSLHCLERGLFHFQLLELASVGTVTLWEHVCLSVCHTVLQLQRKHSQNPKAKPIIFVWSVQLLPALFHRTFHTAPHLNFCLDLPSLRISQILIMLEGRFLEDN